MKTFRALILCGGFGLRLRPLTMAKPKVMIDVVGKPCLERIVDHLAGFGITEVMVNLHWLYPQILEYFGNSLVYLYEPELLGTGGTIKKALPWLGENFLVLNGDTPTNLDLNKFINWYMAHQFHAAISVKENSTICDGAMIFNKSILKYLPEKGMIDEVINTFPRNMCGYYFDPKTVRFYI